MKRMILFIAMIIVGLTLSIVTIIDGETEKKEHRRFAEENISEQNGEEASDDNIRLEKYRLLKEKNKDFYGWLGIKDTIIDYPVMFTPDAPQKYLRKNYDGEYSRAGTLFIDAACDPDKLGTNIIIYGHNMHTGSMFHILPEYENEEFYKAHKYIEFDTTESVGTYEVIAAFKTRIGDDFDVYSFINPDDEEEYDDFIRKSKERTGYQTTESTYGDDLITLSTCSYHCRNGRFVVIAKRVW